jgi:beta-lactamase superfamily II metal-dependent hydrolase
LTPSEGDVCPICKAEPDGPLLAPGKGLRRLLLKVPCHAADASLTLPFLRAVNPQRAIIPVDAEDLSGHPDEVPIGKLKDIPAYRTDQQGSTEVVSDRWQYSVLVVR